MKRTHKSLVKSSLPHQNNSGLIEAEFVPFSYGSETTKWKTSDDHLYLPLTVDTEETQISVGQN